MISPGARPSGPAGVIPPPSPLDISRAEVSRLRKSIQQAEAFAARVRDGIARNADPRRFFSRQNATLAKAMRDSADFGERTRASVGRSSNPKLLQRQLQAKKIDVQA